MVALMMQEDPENRTRWKHKWRWHNHGNVWNKMATRWAGGKSWTDTRMMKNTREEKYKFVTFVLSKMKLSTEHMKTKNENKEKSIKDKTPRDLGDAIISSERRKEETCVDYHTRTCMVARKTWVDGLAFSV